MERPKVQPTKKTVKTEATDKTDGFVPFVDLGKTSNCRSSKTRAILYKFVSFPKNEVGSRRNTVRS